MVREKCEFWEKKLRECGLRLTRQRKEILRVLIKTNGPLNARKIFSELTSSEDFLELSTVYRNLQAFSKRGLIREIDLGTGEKYFELNTGEHHHHLICMGCGEVLPLGCPLRHLEKDLSRETNYSIIDHRLNVYGVCPTCQEK